MVQTISGGRVFSRTKSTLLLTLKTPQTISSSHTRELTNIELTNIDVGDDDATQSKSKTPEILQKISPPKTCKVTQNFQNIRSSLIREPTETEHPIKIINP